MWQKLWFVVVVILYVGTINYQMECYKARVASGLGHYLSGNILIKAGICKKASEVSDCVCKKYIIWTVRVFP